MLARAYQALLIFKALLKPHKFYNVSSPVKLFKELTGLAKIWAQVVLGIRLIYCEFFIRPGPSSRVGYPFQL